MTDRPRAPTPTPSSPHRRPAARGGMRLWLAAAVGLAAAVLFACGGGGGGGGASAGLPAGPSEPVQGLPVDGPTEGRLSLALDASGEPVTRALLGSNVQWVDRGDGLLDTQGRLREDMLQAVRAMGIQTLRYPGGALADAYRWERGMGPLASRGLNRHVHSHTEQRTLMGTQEFLELCEAVGAEPLITVNIATGTPEEAAAWVRQVNVTGLTSRRTGQPLPAVRDWELGNEPHLKIDDEPALWTRPEVFAQRVRAFAQAMRAADPGIRLVLPLSLNQRNGHPVTAYQDVDFIDTVLAGGAPDVDAISLHNAYVPFGMEARHSDAALYWGGMAGAHTFEADLAEVRRRLTQVWPGRTLPLAITEHGPLFTLGRGDSDALIRSPAGALVLADLLRVFGQTPDLTAAHHWSLSGNWHFGALRDDATARPAAQVMGLFAQAWQGRQMAVAVQAPRVATASVGGSAAVPDLPLLEALGSQDGDVARVWLVHKHPSQPMRVTVADLAPGWRAVRLHTLSAEQLFDRREVPDLLRAETRELDADAPLLMPPASIGLLVLQRGAAEVAP